MSKIAVVILNWNGRAFLEQFLPSVVQYSSIPDVSVVVADNGSSDDSLEFIRSSFSSVRIIALDKNYGFAGGYNKALQQLDEEYFILLNSDVEVTAGWIEPMLRMMEQDRLIAAMMPKILSHQKKTHFEYAGAAGGFIDRYGYPFCRGRILQTIEDDHNQYNEPMEVFWASGACMFVRAASFRLAGGFDESFFAHMEEIDLCWRMKNLGMKIFVCPASVIYHAGGGTLEYKNPHKLYLNFRNSLATLYKNTHPGALFSTLIIRILLDKLAVLRFLLQFDFASAGAVIRGYSSFFCSLKKLNKQRKAQKISARHHGQMNNSIILQYYFRNRKRYSELSPIF